MSILEKIVRPAQIPGIRPLNFTVPRTKQKVPGDNTFIWGNGGDDIFTISAHAQQDLKPAEWEESDRKYDVVRIENPDDSNQYVEAEVMTEYQARNKIDKTRTQLRFYPPQATDNQKIVSRGNKRKTPGSQ